MSDDRMHGGFKVIGPNMADGGISVRHFHTRKDADDFARRAAESTRGTFDVCKPLGYWGAAMPPVEWTKAPKK